MGNKIDLSDQSRVVTTEQGTFIADKFNMPFLEVSAKTGEYISKQDKYSYYEIRSSRFWEEN